MREVGAELLLGKAVQAARKQAGLTQQELCHKTGVSYSTLAKIERGAIASPSVFTVAHIAAVCGVSIEELVKDTTGYNTVAKKAYKRASNGIEFVFFDVNGCMVQYFQRAFSQISADTGVSPEVIEGAFWHFNDSACKGEMTADQFDAAMAERLGIESLDWQKYYLDDIEPIAIMQDGFAHIAEHYKVGLLTNIMPGLINKMLERRLLPSVKYQAIVDSSKVGFIKPEPEIYTLATKASGTAPANILLVDDSHVNLMAAEKAGWHVMWFDGLRPEETIARLNKMLEI